MREIKSRNNESLVETNDQISIKKLGDRTQIVFKKAVLKGKVSQQDVLNTVLIASRMQAEMYVKKLSRGMPLDNFEVKALRDLGEIAKIKIDDVDANAETFDIKPDENTQSIKSNIYQALTKTLSGMSMYNNEAECK